jgi:acetyltransferase-like isoleucine patch superfamily enzyme
LYANLVRLGNNVHLASGVSFITHDITHTMLNNVPEVRERGKLQERVGCIEIGDNVFVGAATKILYDTRIGSNVIIGAGSLVTKDIPSGSVVAGSPAKVIDRFDDFVEKALARERVPAELLPKHQTVSPELARILWEKFDREHADA